MGCSDGQGPLGTDYMEVVQLRASRNEERTL